MDFSTGEEILDILFDKEDPLLKDVDYYLDDNINESYNELKSSVFQNNDHDFWNSFMKDVENDYNGENKYFTSHLDTDSTSYCNSLSPQSASSNSENNESGYLIESANMTDYSTIDVPKVTAVYHSYASPAPVENLSTNIDIGADVVITTSDSAASDSSFHSVDIGSESEVIEMPKKKQSRKRTLEDSVFESVPEILKLTEDEKKLIKKEGLHIPTHLPLTKAEEKELKRIRRKIRNKQSAQESRKRKKEYVDGLETRVKICTAENIKLQKKVITLEKEQKGLLDKIKQLQETIANSTAKSVQTSTCFMVVFMSLALVLFPNLLSSPLESKEMYPGQKQPVSRTSRTLFQVTENSDSSPIQDKMTDENISCNHIKHIPEIKPEGFDEAFPKIFEVFNNIPPIKTEPVLSSEYEDVPIDMHSNSADLSTQNKNSYTVISNETNSKKKIMLFNK